MTTSHMDASVVPSHGATGHQIVTLDHRLEPRAEDGGVPRHLAEREHRFDLATALRLARRVSDDLGLASHDLADHPIDRTATLHADHPMHVRPGCTPHAQVSRQTQGRAEEAGVRQRSAVRSRHEQTMSRVANSLREPGFRVAAGDHDLQAAASGWAPSTTVALPPRRDGKLVPVVVTRKELRA